VSKHSKHWELQLKQIDVFWSTYEPIPHKMVAMQLLLVPFKVYPEIQLEQVMVSIKQVRHPVLHLRQRVLLEFSTQLGKQMLQLKVPLNEQVSHPDRRYGHL